MKRRSFGLLVLCVLLAGLMGTARSAERVGTLAGTVVDGQGQPIAGASVTIQTSDGQHPHATRTDSSGQFQFVRFEIGQYDMRAYGGGKYSDWAKRVMIRSGRVTRVTLRIAH
jgi:hypothetical protein